MPPFQKKASSRKIKKEARLKLTEDCLLSYLKKTINSKPPFKNYTEPDLCLQQLTKALEDNDLDNVEFLLPQAESVAKSVVSKLSTEQALHLLEVLKKKVAESTQKGNHLFYWLRAILYYHSAQLERIPDLKVKLVDLHHMISSRALMYSKLQKIDGRIDLIFDLLSKDGVNNKKNTVNREEAEMDDLSLVLSSDSNDSDSS